MASKQELLDRISELEAENQDLTEQIDAIADIVSPDEEDPEESEEEDSEGE